MKPTFIAALLLVVQSLAATGESASPRVPQPRRAPESSQAPRAWLGLRVAKPDATVAAQLPSLPPGIGFLVKSLDEGGPAQVAGLLEMDLLWKIGDQMLVNEAQLATLLRLSKPADEVVLSAFRGGKPLEVRLKLGEAPVLQQPFPGEMVEAAILPDSGSGPMRVVNVAEKTASFSGDEGKATVHRDAGIHVVKIEGPQGETIFTGEISKDADLDRMPEAWQRRVRVLCRTLDRALEGGMIQQRQPRPRVVPPPAGTP